MDNQQIDLKTKGLTELKALAYDFGVMMNEYRNMLNIINQEIATRIQEESSPTKQNIVVKETPNEVG
jgi:hypothetical protein